MKLADVINPELVLDVRGKKNFREFHREILSRIVLPTHNEGIRFLSDNEAFNTLLHDPHAGIYFILTKIFKESSEHKCFYLTKDFGEALASIDREIPADLLPNNFIGYIHFAKDSVFDEESEIAGAYVYTGPAKYVALKTRDPEELVFCAAYFPRTPDGSMSTITKVCISLSDINDRGELQQFDIQNGERLGISPEVVAKRNVINRTLLNTLLYIQTRDASYLNLPPKHQYRKQYQEILQKTGFGNLTSLSLKVINAGYMKPKEYQVDETWVKPHPRWQRCGPGLTEHKLVFVTGHIRKFND